MIRVRESIQSIEMRKVEERMDVCVSVRVYTCMHVHIYEDVNVGVCMYVYTHACGGHG